MIDPTSLSRRYLLAGAAVMPLAGTLFSRAARAQAAPPPLTVLGKLPAVENVALSPNGKRVAMVMTRNGERIIIDYDLTTGATAAGAIEGDNIRRVMWVDNETVMVATSSADIYAGDLISVMLASMFNLPKGKRSILYTNVPGAVRGVTGDFYRIKTDEGYKVAASSFKDPEGINLGGTSSMHANRLQRCLYAFSTKSSLSTNIDTDARPIQQWALQPDGAPRGRSEYDDDTKTWLLRYRDSKGWREIFKMEARYDKPWLAGLGRDGKTLLVRFDSGETADRYYEFDGTGAKVELDIDGSYHLPVFHPATNVLVGFRNNGPISDWTFYDPVFQRLPKLLDQALPDSFNDILDMAENPRQLVVRSESPEDPGTYFYFDFTTGDFKEIGSAYPQLPAEWISPKSYITYKAGDGLEIGAWLTLPVTGGDKNLALVVLPHGGPEDLDDVRFDWLSQAIATRGYAVLQANFRGSSGYGKAFTEKGYGEFGRKMQTDLSDGVAHLVKQGIADPKRVAIVGKAYGGYAALAGVSLQSGIYNCAIAIAGLSDLRTFIAYRREREGFDNDSYNLEYWRRFMGPEGGWDTLSPARNADAIGVPVLLIHGKDDVVVPFDQSNSFYQAMTKAGKPVELTQLKQEDHWLSREPTRVQTLEAMMAFLLKHNPA
ncbi:S9 family peptidase [Asticcacaulis sp. AC402]|uniref:alpha/beta hydrolase family protein n=1 Tax=Asticcacaulis sp. AC402 TaxID=1282361 RepID=UPI0003C40711|nr:prolyl oligopeptidase family serine peptidase [Asticcacaulis sp. AC402]ESQ73866.1 hypothetical protein ABAC402_17105 [Asticcacaulis sp. AC402]